jgi:DUF438 domain-containing protein
MKPSEIRKELLGQHNAIRGKMAEARHAASARELHRLLVEVGELFRAHNAREEELMTDVFPTLDAWGMVRAEVMVGEHIDEHREIFETLLVANATSDAVVAKKKAIELFDRILDHMHREEKVFLCEEVLTDDGFVPDAFGG